MKELTWLMFTMLVLANYRLTHLIVFDKITEWMRKPFLRYITVRDDQGEIVEKKEPTSMFGYLVNCYWCAGIWSAFLIGTLFILFPVITVPIVFILALAGGQSILETFVGFVAKSSKHPK